MKIKEKIKAIREARGTTCAFIADAIGMHRSNYIRFEKAIEEKTYIETLQAICKVLGITLNELLNYGEPDSRDEDILTLKKELQDSQDKNRELLASYIKLSNAYIDLQAQISK